MAKKKRSPKQLANDKRLGRMAKKRAAAKRVGKTIKKRVAKKVRRKLAKKTARRKNPARKTSAKSHLWRVFRCRGKFVMWLLMDSTGKWNWTSDAGRSILFPVKQSASNVAGGLSKKRGYAGYNLGVASRETTAAQIVRECGAGK